MALLVGLPSKLFYYFSASVENSVVRALYGAKKQDDTTLTLLSSGNP